jgi:hypothetical protein
VGRFFSNIYSRKGLRPGHASLMCLAIGVATAWSLAHRAALARAACA